MAWTEEFCLSPMYRDLQVWEVMKVVRGLMILLMLMTMILMILTLMSMDEMAPENWGMMHNLEKGKGRTLEEVLASCCFCSLTHAMVLML